MNLPERHKMPWTPREDQHLATSRKSGTSIEQLAIEHQRTPNSITLRLMQLDAVAPMPRSGQFGIMRMGRQMGKLRFFKPDDAREYIRQSIPVEKRSQFTVVQTLEQSELTF